MKMKIKKEKKKSINKPIVKNFTIGRNDNCPCKSGKKWKQCCLEVLKFNQKMFQVVYLNESKMPVSADMELKKIIKDLILNNKISRLWDWIEKNAAKNLTKENIETITGMTRIYENDETRKKIMRILNGN